MEDQEKNIDDIFRNALDDYGETPPPAVWKSLQGRLANAPSPSFARRIWYVVLPLLLLLSVPAKKMLRSVAAIPSSRSYWRGIWFALPLLVLLSIPAIKMLTPSKTVGTITGNTGSVSRPESASGNDNKNQHSLAVVATPSPASPSSPASAGAQALPSNNNRLVQGPAPENLPVGNNNGGGKNTRTAASKNSKLRTTANHASAKHHIAMVQPVKNNAPESETQAPEQPVYNSSPSNPAPDNTNAAQKETVANKDNKAPSPAKNKEPQQKENINTRRNQPPAVQFGRFEAGLKLGFESGFDNETSRKAVLSPYLQYNITPRLSIMTQPALKYASLFSHLVGNSKSYYKENADSAAVQTGPSTPVFPIDGGTLYITPFKYSQSHDSIIKSSRIGGGYAEAELPLLLKYAVGKDFFVYGGANIVYSKSIAIKENTATYRNITVIDSPVNVISAGKNPLPYPTESEITYNGTDISKYTGPQFPATQTDEWRVGYMIGFTYRFDKRWLLDWLIEQANAKPNMAAGYNANTALSEPYFRISLGYQLTK